MPLFHPTFEPGQSILYRELDEHGVLVDVKPVTVVEDAAETIALWLPLNTRSKNPVFLDHTPGAPRRWLPGNKELQDAEWRWAEILILIRPRQPRATWVRWSDTREFLGLYVNMQSPLFRTPIGFDTRDHQLDILVDSDRAWRWKDEDELASCARHGRLSREEASFIRAEGKRAVEDIEQGVGYFSQGWARSETNELDKPEMSSRWDDLTMYA
tara:strand:- start:3115 stop:3753 length:639 start_codon:yes stop_codon:yes gene_type:complete